MFIRGELVNAVTAGEGVSRKLLACGGTMMVAEVTFQKDSIGKIHFHLHEQVSYIIQGSFEFNLDGKTQIVEKGDSIYIASNILHGVKALENESIILDIFTPPREDFL